MGDSTGRERRQLSFVWCAKCSFLTCWEILNRNPGFCLLLSHGELWQQWPRVCAVTAGETGRDCSL